MTAPYPYGRTIHVQSLTGYDRYGDYTFGAARVVRGCALVPRTSGEDNAQRDNVSYGVTLYCPADAAITATDIVYFDGDPAEVRWQVVGEPITWSSPFTGWTPGQEVNLQRSDG